MNSLKSIKWQKLLEGFVYLLIGFLIFFLVSPQFFLLYSMLIVIIKYKARATSFIIIMKLILIELSIFRIIPGEFGLLHLIFGFITSAIILLLLGSVLTMIETKNKILSLILGMLLYGTASFYYLAQMFFFRHSGDFFSILVLRNSVYTVKFLDIAYTMFTVHDVAYIFSVGLMLYVIIKEILFLLECSPDRRFALTTKVRDAFNLLP